MKMNWMNMGCEEREIERKKDDYPLFEGGG